jgi:hypothetical protein
MRVDHNFPIDQFIAEASTLRWFDGITAGMRVSVHKVRIQDAHVRLMHPRYQAMRLELDFGVDPMRTSRVEQASK